MMEGLDKLPQDSRVPHGIHPPMLPGQQNESSSNADDKQSQCFLQACGSTIHFIVRRWNFIVRNGSHQFAVVLEKVNYAYIFTTGFENFNEPWRENVNDVD